MFAEFSFNTSQLGVMDLFLLSVNVILVGLLLWQAHFFKRRFNELDERFSQGRNKLQSEIKTTARGTYGVGQRVMQLEKHLQQQLQQHLALIKQTQLSIHNTNVVSDSGGDAVSDRVYEGAQLDEAELMFERGVDADTIAQSCGLSRSEASLMALIRGHREEEAV